MAKTKCGKRRVTGKAGCALAERARGVQVTELEGDVKKFKTQVPARASVGASGFLEAPLAFCSLGGLLSPSVL
jgi:hypothetical protein